MARSVARLAAILRRLGGSLRSQLISLQGSHHVDNALVDMRQLDIRQRPLVGRAHVGVDHLFSLRLVNRKRCGDLQLANHKRGARPLAE